MGLQLVIFKIMGDGLVQKVIANDSSIISIAFCNVLPNLRDLLQRQRWFLDNRERELYTSRNGHSCDAFDPSR